MKEKVLSALAVVILLTLNSTGCTKGNAPAESPAARSATHAQLGIKYARNFSIDYLDGGVKLVTDARGDKLLLVPEGVNAPSGYADAVIVETPIKRAMYTSTTHVGLLGALEDDSLYDSVAIVITPEENWTTPQVLERFSSGVTRHIGDRRNIEEIVKMNPDLVFCDPHVANTQFYSLLNESNIKHATVLEWEEEGDKESLEWIKFFAAFFNLDKEANSIFEAKLALLNELYEKTANASDTPTVAYGYISRGVVYVQPGNSVFAQQIEKSGGIYVFKELEGSGSVVITMEKFLEKGGDADILIYGSLPQNCPDKAFLLGIAPLMAQFRALDNNKVYTLDRGYYMNSAKVVEKFADMASIIHPEMLPEHELVMYRKLPD